MDRKITITLAHTAWSGWDPEGYSIVTSATLHAAKGKILSPETLGKNRSDYVGVEFLFYEVLIEHIVADRAGFAYKRLVLDNFDGTINLSAPYSGQFVLRPGESRKLSTPTMDGGTSVIITLHEIR